MKKNNLIVALLLLCVVVAVEKSFASSANPNPVRVTQMDGTQITVTLQGDERMKWAKSEDGYALIYNKDGNYEYAKLNASGDMVPSGVRAHDVSKRGRADLSFLATVPKNLCYSKAQVDVMKQVMNISRIIKSGPPQKGGNTVQGFPTTGSRKLICILIGYSDKAFTKTSAEFVNLFNQVGYSVDGATGSVKDFYEESSYGQLHLTVDVAGPYTASNTLDYYGHNDGSGNDEHPRELITEAITLADPDVDYNDYDNDGDATLDGVYVIYAGYGEEGGAPSNTIWAHAWDLAAPVVLDGVSISKYSTSSELRGTSGSGLTRIGVMCHEFGHVLGAPDYYDTDYATGGQYTGTGQWDLMANGSWNGGGTDRDGRTPAHQNPYTKTYDYGWASVTTLSANTVYDLYDQVTNSGSFYRFNTTTANEYFIMENRQQTGFDAEIPGHGLLIFHALDDYATGGNTTSPQKFYPVCANAGQDPGGTPASYGSINTGGCTFPGTGAKTEFTDATLPSQKSDAGNATAKPIYSISESGGVINFCFMGCEPVADFTSDASYPTCTGETVSFTDLSEYTPTSWAWVFAPATVSYTGGTNATSQNPKVIFNAAGLYTVTLTATNAFGSDDEVKTDYITVYAAPSITLQPANVAAQWGDNVSFTSTATGTPEPTVQWQLNTGSGGAVFSDLSGETNTTLNLSCVTLDMDGYQYRAKFSNICGTTYSDAATLTVTKKTVTANIVINPNPQQYSDTVTITVTITNGYTCGTYAATGADISIGTQFMGTVTFAVSGSDLVGALYGVVLLEPVPFGTAPTGQMAPGNHLVTAVLSGVDSNFDINNSGANLLINAEDARVTYTGAVFSGTTTATSFNAVVTLSATIQDITDVPADPSYDPFPGEIRNARVTFYNRDNNTIIASNIPVGLVNAGDTKVGAATYNWNVTISGSSQTFTIGIIVTNYYTRDASADNTIITVAQPIPGNFITAHGYLILQNSAGIKAGDAGSQNDFDVNVKYNNGRGPIQGTLSTVFRRTESDGVHTYRAASGTLTSLSVSGANGMATLNSIVSITDITNTKTPVLVDGSASLQMNFVDVGGFGKLDSAAITIWNRKIGGLWFASTWNGTQTIEKVLGQGNVQTHSNAPPRMSDEANALTDNSSLACMVYPNPNTGQFTLSLSSEAKAVYYIRLTDIAGREVFSESFPAVEGVNIRNFDFTSLAGGLYLMAVENDEYHRLIKVMVQSQ